MAWEKAMKRRNEGAGMKIGGCHGKGMWAGMRGGRKRKVAR